MASPVKELKVKRDLLNPGFDGYKLSLHPLPHYELQLSEPVLTAGLSDRQYSAEHLKAFGSNNHLIVDEWQEDTVYFIDSSRRIMRVRLPADCRGVESATPVARLPGNENLSRRSREVAACSPTMSFASAGLACCADGLGRLVVMETGDRAEAGGGENRWETLGCVRPQPEAENGEGKEKEGEEAFALLEASASGESEVDCLLLLVEQANEATAAFHSLLIWLTLRLTDSGPKIVAKRSLTTPQVPVYAAFDRSNRDRRTLLLGCYGDYHVVTNPSSSSSSSSPPAPHSLTYSWSQTDESVTVKVPLPKTVINVNQLDVKINRADISVKVIASELIIIAGRLYEPIEPDESDWTLERDEKDEAKCCRLRLEGKRTKRWPLLLMGHDRPAGDGLGGGGGGGGMEKRRGDGEEEEEEDAPYNAQELEECDLEEAGQSLKLTRLVDESVDSAAGCLTAIGQCNLDAYQWLFQRRLGPNEAPSLCLRRDVDGLVWRPAGFDGDGDDGGAWRHVATFDAFGFVRASKREAKFVSCSRDFAYCAVCDCYRHVYIYHSPSGVATELRNRTTGRTVRQIASQQVASVGNQEALIGFACLKDKIALLTERCLHLLSVKPPP